MLQPLNCVEGESQALIKLTQNFVLGRNPSSNFVVSDAAISRTHCIFSKNENDWFIQDVSNNGIWVREAPDSDEYEKLVKDEKYRLNDNEELRLSETRFYKFIAQKPRSKPAVDECKKPLGSSSANSNENSLEGFAPAVVIKKLATEDSESRSQLELVQKNLVSIYEKQIENLTSQIADVKKQSELSVEKEKELAAAKERTLRLELDLERNVLEQEKYRADKLKSDLNDLKESTRSEVDKLKEITVEWQSKFADLEKEGTILQDNRKILEDENKMLKDDNLKLKNENQALETRLVQIEAGKDYALENQLEKFEELIESEAQCAICFEMVIKPCSLNCGHVFCDVCIGEWRKKTPCCPSCRCKIKRITRVTMVDSLLAKMTDTLTEDFKQKRKLAVDERVGIEGNPPTHSKRRKKGQTHVNTFFVTRNIAIPEPQVFIDLTTTPNPR